MGMSMMRMTATSCGLVMWKRRRTVIAVWVMDQTGVAGVVCGPCMRLANENSGVAYIAGLLEDSRKIGWQRQRCPSTNILAVRAARRWRVRTWRILSGAVSFRLRRRRWTSILSVNRKFKQLREVSIHSHDIAHFNALGDKTDRSPFSHFPHRCFFATKSPQKRKPSLSVEDFGLHGWFCFGLASLGALWLAAAASPDDTAVVGFQGLSFYFINSGPSCALWLSGINNSGFSPGTENDFSWKRSRTTQVASNRKFIPL